MFDIGSSEFFLILLVAIILLNPKDLPNIIKKTKIFLKHFSTIKQELNKTIEKLEGTFEETTEQTELNEDEFLKFKKEYLGPLKSKNSLPQQTLKKSKKAIKVDKKQNTKKVKFLSSKKNPTLAESKSSQAKDK